jgi:hypothetical protein
MPTLKDNLKAWRESAHIDWFSHFIKAWIPFNAWMTNTFGDLKDSELLDNVKGGHNVVYNRIVPMLTWRPAQAQGMQGGWQDQSQEAEEFRIKIEQLHRLLQNCLVEGRKGRVSFETVDIGYNAHADEQVTHRTRQLRCRRNHPTSGQVTLEMSATQTRAAFTLTQIGYSRRALEDEPSFQELNTEYRTTFLAMYEAIAPRKVISVLAPHGSRDVLPIGNIQFIPDTTKVFSALVDVIYNLRNALFHGSITPTELHNAIYEPAYHIVMRLVQCTI